MPVLFGHLYIAPILIELAQEHPRLTFEMSFSDRMVGMLEEGFDAPEDVLNQVWAAVDGDPLLHSTLLSFEVK